MEKVITRNGLIIIGETKYHSDIYIQTGRTFNEINPIPSRKNPCMVCGKHIEGKKRIHRSCKKK